mmetsp:Transcript_4011/g.8350  ORF Transcript_4011/g.8350 Transcript_4011/m.8350 type:complete len:273 (+) Transcript_4011:1-819(+)
MEAHDDVGFCAIFLYRRTFGYQYRHRKGRQVQSVGSFLVHVPTWMDSMLFYRDWSMFPSQALFEDTKYPSFFSQMGITNGFVKFCIPPWMDWIRTWQQLLGETLFRTRYGTRCPVLGSPRLAAHLSHWLSLVHRALPWKRGYRLVVVGEDHCGVAGTFQLQCFSLSWARQRNLFPSNAWGVVVLSKTFLLVQSVSDSCPRLGNPARYGHCNHLFGGYAFLGQRQTHRCESSRFVFLSKATKSVASRYRKSRYGRYQRNTRSHQQYRSFLVAW